MNLATLLAVAPIIAMVTIGRDEEPYIRKSLFAYACIIAVYDSGARKEPVPIQPGDAPVTCADILSLERGFGCWSVTRLEDGLRELYDGTGNTGFKHEESAGSM